MSLLEKREPSSSMSGIENSYRNIEPDRANKIASLLRPCASAMKPTRKLRSRRKEMPSAESLGEGVVLENSANLQQFSAGKKQTKKKYTSGKNIVFNTCNPTLIWLANNELHLSLFLLAIVHGCYSAGYQWPLLCIQLQHKAMTVDSHGVRYVRGIHDIKFVACWIVQIIAARALCLRLIMPAIASLISVKGSREIRRFSEMAWMLLYITVSWTVGFRVWQNSPYYMTTATLFANYPDDHVLMPYGLKWYYLVQTAFWLSNVYTIHVEERRKDHFEMLTHHAVTIFLVLSSYQCHFTRFGHAFMLVMDFPDIFLTSAKMFRYMGSKAMPNVLFGLFAASWVFTKHYLCIKMMLSSWKQGLDVIPYEKRFPHYPNSYASPSVASFFWILLCVLQLILLYWFVLIVKVIQRMLIKGEDANDNRSDDEGASIDDNSSALPDLLADKKSLAIDNNTINDSSNASTLTSQDLAID
ncbi:Sphingosine N-acyltransferase lag1 [Coemansia sp. RSA 487]|nr:Sphingosine N-acyltransferase lag1 [Coemansia sp. RSA 487]